MSNYALAWVVVVSFGLGGAFVLHRLLYHTKWLIKAPVLGATLAMFIAAAPVPRFEGHFAPAFIVFVFELLFQIDGQPNTAGGILLLAIVFGALAAWLVAFVVRKKPDQGHPAEQGVGPSRSSR
ncbi:MAG: hypothetical protein GKR90_03515 [Pseudomonadales bacterium]|nr:hypothetical protein [Pseudomonadales bacterium]